MGSTSENITGELVCSHFNSLRTYAEDEDPRGFILPSMLLRVAITNVASSPNLNQSTRDELNDYQSALTSIQRGTTMLFRHQFTTTEYKLMNQFPIAWMLTLLSHGKNDGMVKLLKLDQQPYDEVDKMMMKLLKLDQQPHDEVDQI